MSTEHTPSKSERTRAAILDAAEDLFSEVGFDGASLDAIGERAGIQGTAILYHFPSKRALYEATLGRIFNPLLVEVDGLLDGSQSADGLLDSTVEAIVDYAAQYPNAPRLLLRETASTSSDAREIIAARVAADIAGIMEAFTSRSRRRAVDPVMAANIIIGAVCFYFVGSPGLADEEVYDPRDPDLVAAFRATMCELTRSMLGPDRQGAGQPS